MKIGIDIDGVLADFNRSFKELIKAQTGIELPPLNDSYPATWSYHTDAGVTEEQDNALWDYIGRSPFWGTLLPLKDAPAILAWLNTLGSEGHSVYFITSRNGDMAKYWTELWLRLHGMETPTVLISSNKGNIAKGLRLDAFIDDRPENNYEVLQTAKKTKSSASQKPWKPRVYLIDAPYNRWADQEENYGRRVKTVKEVLEAELSPLDAARAA